MYIESDEWASYSCIVKTALNEKDPVKNMMRDTLAWKDRIRMDTT